MPEENKDSTNPDEIIWKALAHIERRLDALESKLSTYAWPYPVAYPTYPPYQPVAGGWTMCLGGMAPTYNDGNATT